MVSTISIITPSCRESVSLLRLSPTKSGAEHARRPATHVSYVHARTGHITVVTDTTTQTQNCQKYHFHCNSLIFVTKNYQLFSHPVIRSESWRKSLFDNNFIFAYNCNFKTKKFCSLTTSLLSGSNKCRAGLKYLLTNTSSHQFLLG